MAKYINADLLRKEIEVQRDLFIGHAAILKKTVATDGFDIVIKVINSLQQEQQEVDFEKEVRTYCGSSFRFNYDELCQFYLNILPNSFVLNYLPDDKITYDTLKTAIHLIEHPLRINLKKKQIVIDNYFTKDCNIDTTIRQAYEKGFDRGLQKASI